MKKLSHLYEIKFQFSQGLWFKIECKGCAVELIIVRIQKVFCEMKREK